MRKGKRRFIFSTLVITVLFMTITSVYAAKTSQKQVLPIYIAKGKKGIITPSIGKFVKQIREPMGKYKNEENLQQLIDRLKNETGHIYLSIYSETLEQQKEVKVLYDFLAQQEELKTRSELYLHFVYTPLNEQDVLFKTMPYVDTLNIDVQRLEDQHFIKYCYAQYKDQYKLILTDVVPIYYGGDVSTGLDVLAKIYYDLPFDYPQIHQVFRQPSLQALPAKYDAFYKMLEEDLQVQYDPIQLQDLGESIDFDLLQFLVRTDEPVEYIEYKVNDAPAGQSFRYPYPITIDKALLHQGMNEMKVVMKVKGNEQYHVQDFYINYKGDIHYQERAARKAQTYPINQQPVYRKVNNKANQVYIPVLMYHKIKDQVAHTEEDQSMSVSTANFEAQLKALLEAGYTPINFKQLKDYLEGKAGLPKRPILITADDGYLCNYTKAYPILKKYNAQATFFVTSLYVGVTNEHEHFTWEQAKEMEASGLIDIQSHTHGHTLMNALDKTDVSYEIQKSFGDIEKYLGKRDVKVLAYPQFLHTSKVKEWANECGVDLQVTNLVSKYRPVATQKTDIKRIHVSNDLSPQKLLSQIKRLTQ